jgi:hypothetical protein
MKRLLGCGALALAARCRRRVPCRENLCALATRRPEVIVAHAWLGVGDESAARKIETITMPLRWPLIPIRQRPDEQRAGRRRRE